MKVLDFPARIDPADPKVAAGLSRLIDDLDLFDAIIGPLDAAVAQTTAPLTGVVPQDAPLPMAA